MIPNISRRFIHISFGMFTNGPGNTGRSRWQSLITSKGDGHQVHTSRVDRSGIGRVFGELAKEHFLEGLPRRDFARKLAALFSKINRIHPFREGNGRAQRQFVRQLAESLSYKLHFEVVSKERLVQASILSTNGDIAMMVRLMDEITDPERIEPLVKVIRHLERGQFNWNDVYVATTTPGRSYAGTFAGSDGANFFFREEEKRVLVGTLKNLTQPVESGEKIAFTAS